MDEIFNMMFYIAVIAGIMHIVTFFIEIVFVFIEKKKLKAAKHEVNADEGQ